MPHFPRKVLSVALSACFSSLAFAPAFANPSGGQVVAGQAVVTGEGTRTVHVTQHSARAVLDWSSFSIASGETTRFVQPDALSVTANRVVGEDPSQILGSLEANGRVVLVNPNGIVLGHGSRVDAAGLVASVHEFSTEEFMSSTGSVRFSGTSQANVSNAGVSGVSNAGVINLHSGGFAALLAPQVENTGVIRAELGTVSLGASQAVTVDLFGNGLMKFAPGDEVLATLGDGGQALINQAGTIAADGGSIYLTARAAQAVVNASVNVGGIVQARHVSAQDGVIHLSGSGSVEIAQKSRLDVSGSTGGKLDITGQSVTQSGTLLAQGGTDSAGGHTTGGGDITVSAERVGLGGTVSATGSSGGNITVTTQGLLSLGERVEAKGTQGAGGHIVYTAGRILENVSASTDVSGSTAGGTVTVQGGHQFASSGTYKASGGTEGGRIDITATDVRLLSAQLEAKGTTQGGHIRIGGAFQGGKEQTDPSVSPDFVRRWGVLPALAASQQTFINDGTNIDVSALTGTNSEGGGTGGTVIVWSDTQTTFLGHIDARGAQEGQGGGGAVELSSKERLRRASLANVQVGDGELLLDPKNIVIGEVATVQGWAHVGILGAGYTPPAGGANSVEVTLDGLIFLVALLRLMRRETVWR